MLDHYTSGSRTEKTKRVLGDVEEINIFDEAEIEAKVSAPEPIIEVPAHKRHKKQKGHLEQILKDVPHEERVITLPEDERICKRCGTPLTSMGREKIRTEVQFLPATVKVIDFYRESFQCLECRKKEHFSIEKPQMPQPVLSKSIASPSSVVHVIAQKYQFSMPLYRQEQEWKSIPSHTSQLGDSGSRRLAHAAGRLHACKTFAAAGNPCGRNASPGTE